MKTQVFASDPSEMTGANVSRASLLSRHPVITAVLICFIDLVVAALIGLAAKALFPQSQPEFVATVALSIIMYGYQEVSEREVRSSCSENS